MARGRGRGINGTKKCQEALTNIQIKHSPGCCKLLFSFQGSKKVASLVIALVEGCTFGVSYSAIFADVPICFLNEEASGNTWSSQHLILDTLNFNTCVLLNSTLYYLPFKLIYFFS